MTRGLIAAIVGGLVVLAVVLGSWYTVDQTERGVLLRNGAVIGTAQILSIWLIMLQIL